METAMHIFTNTNSHGRRLKVFAMRRSLLVKQFKRNTTSLAGTVFAYAPMVVRNRHKAEVKKAYAIVKAMQGAKRKIFWAVLTSLPTHDTRVPPSVQTWLSSCDRYEFHTDARLPYPHVVMHNYSSFREMWRKLRLSITHLYHNAIEYDFFPRSCDDTYVVTGKFAMSDKDCDKALIILEWFCR